MKRDHTAATKIAVIAGAGPAGLTAAYELLKRTDIIPLVLEKSGDIGGISKTVNYKGNRIDIGGHRFFSKSDRVMDWWLKMMPVLSDNRESLHIHYQNKEREVDPGRFPFEADQDKDKVMLVRERLSRIYYLKRFFSYPVQLSADTVLGLGVFRSAKIFCSYLKARIAPIKEERSLEDFMINRFGRELYLTFFKDYTEKVWGIDCREIAPEWGAQRIKGLSITRAVKHALKQQFRKKEKQGEGGIRQKETETSLIEQFLYPKFGPGQMWEEVARQVTELGGTIRMHQEVSKVYREGSRITAVEVTDTRTGASERISCDFFFSTMPVKQLVSGFQPALSPDAGAIAEGLLYRDFITVGLLLDKLKIRKDPSQPAGPANTVADNWIYIQEREVRVGRLQIFNNWSPYMVHDPAKVWIGMEYFCNEGDDLWEMADDRLRSFAIAELEQIGIIDAGDVLDSTVLRMEKAYPAYFGTYDRFDELKPVLNTFENLFLIGRNGMHKYNNSDHSMLTAMVAVDNIAAGKKDKENLWQINTEMEYHEERK